MEGFVVPSIDALVGMRHKARHLTFFPRRQALATVGGNYLSRFRGRGMDFDQVRPYQPGDDIRTIDWRVTARTTKPHTKVFREERERPVLIVTDLRRSMFFGSRRLKSVLACELAATLAWAGLQANDRVAGMVFSPLGQQDIRGSRSHHSVLRFIHQLRDGCAALAGESRPMPTLSEISEDVLRVATPGATVVLISDFSDLDHDVEKQLHRIARHCDLTLVEIHDPLEEELPPPGHYPVTDGRQRAVLNTRNTDVRRDFQQQRLRHRQQLEAMATRLAAGLLCFSTAGDFMPLLLGHYGSGRRGRRGRGPA